MAASSGKKGKSGKSKSRVYILQNAEERKKSIFDHYTLGEQIGQPGQFGRARRAKRKGDGEEFAVKVIAKHRFLYKANHEMVFQDLEDEIRILKLLKHKNIVKLEDVFEDRQNLFLVMELCSGGELYDRIINQTHYSESHAVDVVRQILTATEYFHQNRIIHNDLKPDNFLFDENDCLKVIDFGMSKRLPRMKFLHDLVGTPYYTAPEVIKGNYGTAADIWSIGVVVYVMLFGYPPFYVDPEKYGHLEHQLIYKQIQKGFDPVTKSGYGSWFPDFISVSKAAKDFIDKILRLDPQARPTATELLQHNWLTGGHSTEKIPATVLSSFGNFKKTCAFSTAVCITFMDWLRNDEYDSARKAFENMDANGDGQITFQEFKIAMLKNTSMTEEKVDQMFLACDINNDHVIKYKELVTALTHEHIRSNDERLHQAFLELDEDDDGYISVADLSSVMTKHNLRAKPVTVEHFISTADKDGDGRINFHEFLQAVSPELFDQHGGTDLKHAFMSEPK